MTKKVLFHSSLHCSQNAEPVKLVEGKVQAAKALIDAKEKRRAFGDINSRFA